MWEDLVRARTGESNNGGPVGPSEKAPGEPSERPGAGASRWQRFEPGQPPQIEKAPKPGAFSMWEDLVRARTGESNNGGPVGPSEKAPGEPSERPGAHHLQAVKQCEALFYLFELF